MSKPHQSCYAILHGGEALILDNLNALLRQSPIINQAVMNLSMASALTIQSQREWSIKGQTRLPIDDLYNEFEPCMEPYVVHFIEGLQTRKALKPFKERESLLEDDEAPYELVIIMGLSRTDYMIITLLVNYRRSCSCLCLPFGCKDRRVIDLSLNRFEIKVRPCQFTDLIQYQRLDRLMGWMTQKQFPESASKTGL